MWALIGAASGAASAAVNGGNVLQGAVIGAFTAGVSMGAGGGWQGFFTNAVAGGLASRVAGGNFGHGFWAAGLSSAAGGNISTGNAVTSVVIAGVIGGTISKLTGGKFANGAITAAFSAAVREETSKMVVRKPVAGYVDGENSGLSNEVRSKLNDLMRTDKNEAIKYAAEYLGLDLGGATEVKADMGLRGFGQLSPSGVLSIGRDGFKSPVALLSTVGHEAVHLRQWLNKSYSAQVGDPRYHLNEIEAHKWELDNVNRTGFTSGMVNNMNHIRGHMNHLMGTDYYWDVYRDMRGYNGFLD